MKKFILLAAMLALAVALAVPAIAQVGLEAGNEAESGEVATEFAVSNEGDYASQCVPALQSGNSGNFNNAPSFGQFGSGADDFEADGIEFSVGGDLAVECSSTVQQSAAASR